MTEVSEEREEQEQLEIEATPQLEEGKPAPEPPQEPVELPGEPPREDQPGLARWLTGISTEAWLAASVLALLVIMLLGAIVTSATMRNNRRAIQDVVTNSNAQFQELQARVDSLSQELEALQEANAELQRSLESRLTSELEALRQEVQTADRQLRDDVQETLKTEQQALRQELREGLDQTSLELQQMRLETLLLRASRQALQARIHLAEKDRGLSKRNLRNVEAALTAAIQAAEDEELGATLGRLQDSIRELRESIEAETFPVTTVEVLIDQIDEVIQGLSAEQ